MEGFPEDQRENLTDNLVARLSQDANLDFTNQSFHSVKKDKGSNMRANIPPRPVPLLVSDKETHSKLFWINKELPPVYRRRKTMLCDLVKLAIKRGHTVKILTEWFTLPKIFHNCLMIYNLITLECLPILQAIYFSQASMPTSQLCTPVTSHIIRFYLQVGNN